MSLRDSKTDPTPIAATIMWTDPTPIAATIMCVPCAFLLTPAQGSVAAVCHECDQPVWRSPSSFRVPLATVLCLSCAGQAMERARMLGEPVEFGGLLPGQLDELRAALERARRVDARNTARATGHSDPAARQ